MIERILLMSFDVKKKDKVFGLSVALMKHFFSRLNPFIRYDRTHGEHGLDKFLNAFSKGSILSPIRE